MEDFVLPNLYESRNEWVSRLVHILTPNIIDGIRSIFDESMKMCIENKEPKKYLMTFQNLLSRIPNWNSVIVEEEVNRIVKKSGCTYINDLITCVHIIQLKALTCIRVGNKQKKIDISIPKLDHFIHTIYIHVARKLYVNAYLFEQNITPLQYQKNNRELEIIIQECIMTTIRESIPTEAIVRAYLDESMEHEEEIIIEDLPTPAAPQAPPAEVVKPPEDTFEKPTIQNIDNSPVTTKVEITTPPPIFDAPSFAETSMTPQKGLSFNNIDYVLNENNIVENVESPKTIERLEDISKRNNEKRKLEELSMEDENEKIKILDDPVDIPLDIMELPV